MVERPARRRKGVLLPELLDRLHARAEGTERDPDGDAAEVLSRLRRRGDLLERSAAAAEPPFLGRRGLLAVTPPDDAPVEDHFHALLAREHLAQRLVEVAPRIRHDEQEPLHGQAPTRPTAAATPAPVARTAVG